MSQKSYVEIAEEIIPQVYSWILPNQKAVDEVRFQVFQALQTLAEEKDREIEELKNKAYPLQLHIKSLESKLALAVAALKKIDFHCKDMACGDIAKETLSQLEKG